MKILIIATITGLLVGTNIVRRGYVESDIVVKTTYKQREQIETPTREDVRREVARVWWNNGASAKEIHRALQIAKCESGYNYNAKSHTSDHGPMQINAPTWTKVYGEGFIHDWKENIQVGYKIWVRNRSFRPWVCDQKV